MQPERGDELVSALRHAADTLVARRSIRDLEQTLAAIVVAAVDTVPGADAGGISMTEDGRIGSRVPTNDDVLKLDELQSRLNQGPCITAVSEPPEDGVIDAPDLTTAGQAKGILMERFDVDDDRAFRMLVRSSQDTDLELVDVARWLTSPDGRNAT